MASMRLLVTDKATALSFYVGILGFEVVEEWGPAFAIIRHGGLDVWVSGPQTSAAKPLEDGSQPSPGGWNRVVVPVENLDAVLESIVAAGISIRNTPIDGPGGRQALVEDGAGNLVELFESR